MIHNISEAISRKISILNNVTETEEQEIITYGLEAILATAVSVLCVVILSVLLHRVLECIAFLVAFMPLRTYSGGYHASSHMRCVLLLITVFLFEILILHIYDIPSKEVCWVFLICSFLIVCVLAPIIDINHPLSKKQIHENKRRCILVMAVSIVVALVLTHIENTDLLLGYVYGIFVTAISVVAATVANKIKKERRNCNEKV